MGERSKITNNSNPGLGCCQCRVSSRLLQKFTMNIRKHVKDTRDTLESKAITSAMNNIFLHLESHNQCQYSADELLTIAGK